jgi:hypothetical protein
VILTVDFSSIPTSFPLLALAIFLNKLLLLYLFLTHLPKTYFSSLVIGKKFPHLENKFPHYHSSSPNKTP